MEYHFVVIVYLMVYILAHHVTLWSADDQWHLYLDSVVTQSHPNMTYIDHKVYSIYCVLVFSNHQPLCLTSLAIRVGEMIPITSDNHQSSRLLLLKSIIQKQYPLHTVEVGGGEGVGFLWTSFLAFFGMTVQVPYCTNYWMQINYWRFTLHPKQELGFSNYTEIIIWVGP